MDKKVKNIEFLKDDEGLIDTSHIKLDNNGSMFIDNIEVDSLNEAQDITSFLKSNEQLWSILKINLQKKEFGISGSSAPIIGVPFSYGLEKVINGSSNEKSMFYIDDSDLASKGLEGTLLANYNGRKEEIDFQLWEILPLDLPTYYIHGVYNRVSRVFTHFDGALIRIDNETKEKMK